MRLKSALVRAILWAAELLPSSAASRQRRAQLRKEIAALPPLRPVEDGEHPVWNKHRAELREAILHHDPRFFRLWPFVQLTMHPTRRTPYIAAEREALEKAGPRWYAMCRKAETANHIHQAHHLMNYEVATGLSVAKFSSVLEFGGGYGVMAESIRRLGVTGPYTIFDLPEFAALQRYYLRGKNVASVVSTASVEEFRAAGELAEEPELFIATWSLSEAPVAVREDIVAVAEGCAGHLIAYQDRFAGVDNRRYFEEFTARLSHVVWTEVPIPALPGNQYLVGVAPGLGTPS